MSSDDLAEYIRFCKVNSNMMTFSLSLFHCVYGIALKAVLFKGRESVMWLDSAHCDNAAAQPLMNSSPVVGVTVTMLQVSKNALLFYVQLNKLRFFWCLIFLATFPYLLPVPC